MAGNKRHQIFDITRLYGANTGHFAQDRKFKLKSLLSLFFFFLIFIVIIVIPGITPFKALAAQEGISIALQGGQSLYLYKDCYALVVGVGNYDQWPDLPHAVNDAKEVSQFFRQRKFKVKLVLDPGSQDLKKAFDDFVREAGQEPDRAIVFYYVGHGKTQTLADGTKLDWIIPRDCPLVRDNPQGDRALASQVFASRAINLTTIEKFSTNLRSKHALMLFDSAFSGSAFSLKFAALKVIDRNSALPVRQYIIAGREGEHVPDPISQSIFKRFLLKGLKGEADFIHDGCITGSELSYYITSTIGKVSRGRQHPQYAIIKNPALAGGDFVFIPGEVKTDTGRLFVETNPQSAQVKILNKSPLRPSLQRGDGGIVPYKGPQFKQGMELKPGKYQVEVSAAGYTNHKEWITLEAGEDKVIDIQLQKSEEVTATGKATGDVSATGGATGKDLAAGKKAMETQSGSKATTAGSEVLEGTAIGTQIRKRDGVLINSLGMEFVLIKPGNFVMGSPPGKEAKTGTDAESGNASESGNTSESDNDAGNGQNPYDEDEKEHFVIIKKGFHLQTTEVTVGQFGKFIQATGYVTDAEKKGSCWVRTEGGVWRQKKGIGWDSHRSWESAQYTQTKKHPVTCISWNDAQAFIQWLSSKEGVTYELPTEAEWEYACRAGTTTPFSFGRCLSTDQADYDGSGGYDGGGSDSLSVNSLAADCRDSYRINRQRPVDTGSLAPNPWKLFDMHGNVAEWCQDWYAPYPGTAAMPVTDPKGPAGPSGGTERVMRGGHWAVNAQGCRSAKRGSFPPGSASEAIGFRLVMRP